MIVISVHPVLSQWIWEKPSVSGENLFSPPTTHVPMSVEGDLVGQRRTRIPFRFTEEERRDILGDGFRVVFHDSRFLPRLRRYFKAQGVFGWHGQRALDFYGISSFLPIDFIVCCDYGDDTELIEENVKVFSVEKGAGRRRNWSNNSLEEALNGSIREKLQEYLGENDRPAHILCYRSTKTLESLADEYGPDRMKLLSVDVEKKTSFDDKILLREHMEQMGLSPIPGDVDDISTVDYETARASYDTPFVVQRKSGSSGSGTFVVRQKKTYGSLQAKLGSENVIFTRFVKGRSVNVNCCVVSSGEEKDVLVSPLSVQLTGFKECVRKRLDYCGNDFGAVDLFFSGSQIRRFFDISQKLGRWLIQEGWRGMYGMDIMLSGDNVFVDLNPRFQGSTQILTEIQLKHNVLPLAYFHVGEFMDANIPRDYLKDYNESAREFTKASSFSGAQIILHNRKQKYATVGGDLHSGVYRVTNDDLKYIWDGIFLTDCILDEEYVVTCAVPEKGKKVSGDAPLCKVQTWNSVVEEDFTLTDEAKSVVDGVRRGLDLQW